MEQLNLLLSVLTALLNGVFLRELRSQKLLHRYDSFESLWLGLDHNLFDILAFLG